MGIVNLNDPAASIPRGAVVALGNFDGVHKGHASLLVVTRTLAASLGAPPGIITFEPHPRQVLRPDTPPFRLTNAAQKARILQTLGVAIVYVQPFDPRFAALTAADFEAVILKDKLGVKGIVAGPDFLYGTNRGGNFASLQAFGRANSLVVEAAGTCRDERGEPYSSTRIRQALIDGRPDQAAILLGRPWEVSFVVVHGDQRGRTLGYPTANGNFGELIVPAHGIYAVRARLAQGGPILGGVASVGIRPMWKTEMPLIEVHLFDFAQDIYDEILNVELIAYLRPEMKFAGVTELIRQIETDCIQAQSVLSDT